MRIRRALYLLLMMSLYTATLASPSDEDYSDYFAGSMNKSGVLEYSVQILAPMGAIQGKVIIRNDGIEEISVTLPNGAATKLKMIKQTTFSSGIPGQEKEIQYSRRFKEGIYEVNSGDKQKRLELTLPIPVAVGVPWKSTLFDDEIGHIALECKVEGIETLDYLDKDGKIQKEKKCLKIILANKMHDIRGTQYYKKNVGMVRGIYDISGVRMEWVLERYEKGKSGRLKFISLEELVTEKKIESAGKMATDNYSEVKSTKRTLPKKVTKEGLVPERAFGEIKAPKLLKRVDPVYPEIAIKARVAGTVVLEATTDINGRVKNLKVLRSIVLLDQAAIDCVKQWLYEPLIIEGQPREVTFTVTVPFELKKDHS